MSFSVNRIYKNAAGQEIRVDEIHMEMKQRTNSSFFMYGSNDCKLVSYVRRINSAILDVFSDMTVASIELIGNYNSRDDTDFDWCAWEIKLDTFTSGVRDTKSIRCNMSDLPDVGDSVI
jgi:hypothetical protein